MCYSRQRSVARNLCSLGKSMQRRVARNLTAQRRQKSLQPWQKHAGLCHASSSSCRSLHVLSALANPAIKSKLSCTQHISALRNESRLECKALTGISLRSNSSAASGIFGGTTLSTLYGTDLCSSIMERCSIRNSIFWGKKET